MEFCFRSIEIIKKANKLFAFFKKELISVTKQIDHCEKENIYNVKKKLESKVSNFISTDLEWLPINKLKLGKNHYDEVINFLDALEENDDIQKVFSNLEYEV